MCDDKVKVLQIIPQYSKDDFIRKIWLNIASEDSPIDIFDRDLCDVTESFKKIVVCTVNAKLTYTARTGKEREQRVQIREKIDTREVKSERIETVVDWDPTPIIKDTEVTSSISYDMQTRKYSYGLSPAELAECDTVNKEASKILDSDMTEIGRLLYDNIYRTIYDDLYNLYSRNRKIDLDLEIKETETLSTVIYLVPVWETTIEYKGEKYTKKAYPISYMGISGNKINIETKENYIRKKQDENDRRKKSELWKKTKKIDFIAWGCSVLSIILSLSVRSIIVSVLGLIPVSGMFAFSWWYARQEWYKLPKNPDDNTILNQYLQKKYDLLNNKLTSLNLKPLDQYEKDSFTIQRSDDTDNDTEEDAYNDENNQNIV